jgi:hypothetical protein
LSKRDFDRRLATLFLILGLAVTGCATDQSPYTDVVTQDGLLKVRRTGRGHLWVNPEHRLGQYDDLLITGVGFRYKAGEERLSKHEEARIGEMLENTIRFDREGSPVGVTDKAGECVVAVTLGLMDLEFNEGDQSSGSRSSYVTSYGAATMVFEFRDSVSEMPLARYATRRGLGGGPDAGPSRVDLGRLEKALQRMLRDMAEDLYRIIPTSTQTGDHPCNNGLLKLSGRD